MTDHVGIRRRLEESSHLRAEKQFPWLEPVAVLTVTAVFALALYESRGLHEDARLFPVAVAAIGLALGSLALLRLFLFPRKPKAANEQTGDVAADAQKQIEQLLSDAEEPMIGKPWLFWVWFLAFVGAIWGFGFYIGLPIIGGVFVLLESRRWVMSLLVTLSLWIYLYWTFRVLFGIVWFNGVFL